MSLNKDNSTANSRRIVLKDPNGSFIHCYKDGEIDSIFINNKDKYEENQKKLEELTVSDIDLKYILDHFEQGDTQTIMKRFIELLRSKKSILKMCIILDIIFNITIFSMYLFNQQEILIFFKKLFFIENVFISKLLFYIIFCICNVSNLFLYIIGFYGLSQNNIKIIKFFTTFSLITGYLSFLGFYVDFSFFCILIIRIIEFGVGKSVNNLLSSIILLPNRGNNVSYNTFEDNSHNEAINDTYDNAINGTDSNMANEMDL